LIDTPFIPTRFIRAAGLAALFAAGLAAGPALAQSTAPAQTAPAQTAPAQPVTPSQIPVVIGILDTQQVLNESAVGKSLSAQWIAAQKALDDDMAKKEGGLRAQAQQLDQQRAANPPISPADYNAKMKALQTQDDQFQRDYEQKKQALQDRRTKALQAVTNAARKAMQDVARQRGMTLIMDRSAVPYSPQPWNITDDVMARLNKALPNVKL
jgi:Skp family chaperone for outer membrane proteins